jgi:pyruvate ferredoxin oxidoreductase gamma subunit
MAIDTLGRPITNVAMIGAFAGVSGMIDIADADRAIKDHFSDSLYIKNKLLLEEAYRSTVSKAQSFDAE